VLTTADIYPVKYSWH